MMRFLCICLFLTCTFVNAEEGVVKFEGAVEGCVKFIQTSDGVDVEGEISGLTPGLHGFHIHDKGDISNGCLAAGGHFNPYNKNHGAPTAEERHVGDLGNILAGDHGIAKVKIHDKLISLQGETSIIGRAVVVHAGEDDLGAGGNAESLKTGNAGGRVGCGVIQFA